MTLLVRDEADILQANLEYHLAQGVDLFLVTDNRSRDRTPQILDSYERRGLARVFYQPADNHDQHIWVSRMAHLAAVEHDADWVINNDADEFWWPMEGDLKHALAIADTSSDIVSAARHNFPPVLDQQGWFFDRMTVIDRESTNSLGEPLPGKVCHRAVAGVHVGAGNHTVKGKGLTRTNEGGLIEILHFPLRALDLLERKALVGARAIRRNRLSAYFGATWLEYERMLKEGRLGDYFRDHTVEAQREANGGVLPPNLQDDTRLKEFMHSMLDKDPGLLPPEPPDSMYMAPSVWKRGADLGWRMRHEAWTAARRVKALVKKVKPKAG